MGQNDRRSPIMNPALLRRALTISVLAVVMAILPASAQTTLDKVSFGTNWVPEAEHGGFFQAAAGFADKKYGVDATIRPGAPDDNNRKAPVARNVEFFLAANTPEALDPAAD